MPASKYFFLKLVANRSTFSIDMTDKERIIMNQHVGYWTEMMKQGKVVVFGPVMDPAGVFGMGVVTADSEEEIQEFISNDPAISINKYEVYPMRAILPS